MPTVPGPGPDWPEGRRPAPAPAARRPAGDRTGVPVTEAVAGSLPGQAHSLSRRITVCVRYGHTVSTATEGRIARAQAAVQGRSAMGLVTSTATANRDTMAFFTPASQALLGTVPVSPGMRQLLRHLQEDRAAG
eukprot:161025-Hanusia_phi.AAC.1